MELVSVIVPVYNVEKYVERCVNSLLTQTYKNLEIILIDDGSTDQSGCLCDSLAIKDQRIKVVHQKNQGLSGARNAGLNHMKGKFVTFVDSDDYVLENYVESLINILNENNGDISAVSEERFYGERAEITPNKGKKESVCVYSNEQAIATMLYRKGLNSYVWGKLYKKELFEKIRFPVGMIFEDLRIISQLYDLAKRVVFSPVKCYCYYQRQGSIVNSKFNRKKMEQVTASEEVLEFVERYHPQIKEAAISKVFICAVDVFRKIPKGNEYSGEKQYLKKVIKKYRWDIIHDHNNKFYIRIIGVIALINIDILSVIGKAYQKMIEKGLLSGNNRI